MPDEIKEIHQELTRIIKTVEEKAMIVQSHDCACFLFATKRWLSDVHRKLKEHLVFSGE